MSKRSVEAIVVMAAGQGKRLRPITDTVPKSMVEVGGRPLLDRHLEVLASFGIPRIVVVVGWKKDSPKKLCAKRKSVKVVENPIFDKSGSGHSLALGLRELASEGVTGDVAFMDADLLYHPDLFEPLLAPPSTENALLVGHGSEDDQEAVKVRGKGGRVVELRKTKGQGGLEFLGESVGIARLTPDGRTTLLGWMAVREREQGPDYEWEHALEALAPQLELRAVKSPRLPWIEIDTADDLKRASKVLEEIQAAGGTR